MCLGSISGRSSQRKCLLLPDWLNHTGATTPTLNCVQRSDLSHRKCLANRRFFLTVPPVAMYREPSLHDVGETVPKVAVAAAAAAATATAPSSKSTSEPPVMNGGKPVSKPDKPTAAT